jgi:uncharacterized protein YhjY with autotransporter beta-barrel domain
MCPNPSGAAFLGDLRCCGVAVLAKSWAIGCAPRLAVAPGWFGTASAHYGCAGDVSFQRNTLLGALHREQTNASSTGDYRSLRLGFGYFAQHNDWRYAFNATLSRDQSEIKRFNESAGVLALSYGDARLKSD